MGLSFFFFKILYVEVPVKMWYCKIINIRVDDLAEYDYNVNDL